MKTIIVSLSLLIVSVSFANQVNGYYRKNGTYVAPYQRSAPDSYKWNNYGSSKSYNSYGSKSIYGRDSDRDGISNRYDYDDNNNGISDDNE